MRVVVSVGVGACVAVAVSVGVAASVEVAVSVGAAPSVAVAASVGVAASVEVAASTAPRHRVPCHMGSYLHACKYCMQVLFLQMEGVGQRAMWVAERGER